RDFHVTGVQTCALPIYIVYWLGKLAIEEQLDNTKRTITFSPVLRERLGHHIHGEIWADNIKDILQKKGLLERPIHIISANMHSRSEERRVGKECRSRRE